MLSALFSELDAAPGVGAFKLTISYLEIYNETMFDLLVRPGLTCGWRRCCACPLLPMNVVCSIGMGRAQGAGKSSVSMGSVARAFRHEL